MRLALATQRARATDPFGQPHGQRRVWAGPLAFLAASVLAVGVALLAADLLDLTWPVWPLLLAGTFASGIARRVGGRVGKAATAVLLPVNVALAVMLVLELLFNLFNPRVKWLLAIENSMGYAWEGCCVAPSPPGLRLAAAESLVRSAAELSEQQKGYYRELVRAIDADVRYPAQAAVSRRLAQKWALRSVPANAAAPKQAAVSRQVWMALEERFCEAIGGLSPGTRIAGRMFFRSLAELGVGRLPGPDKTGSAGARADVLRAFQEVRAQQDAQRFAQQFREMSEELGHGNRE